MCHSDLTLRTPKRAAKSLQEEICTPLPFWSGVILPSKRSCPAFHTSHAQYQSKRLRRAQGIEGRRDYLDSTCRTRSSDSIPWSSYHWPSLALPVMIGSGVMRCVIPQRPMLIKEKIPLFESMSWSQASTRCHVSGHMQEFNPSSASSGPELT